MVAIATLGDLPLIVQQNDFRYFDSRTQLGFAEHPKLFEKPSLQSVGDELERLSFDFTFHQALVDTEAAVTQFRDLAKAKQPLSFVFGNLYKGRYVIDRFRENPQSVVVQGENATVIILDFRMDLREYADINLRNETPNIALVNPFTFLS